MTIERAPSPQHYVTAALAASRVGTWEFDVETDLFRCDGTMAELYGLPPDQCERGMPLAQVRDIIHPEDLPRHTAQRQELLRNGGLFVIEYRIRPHSGVERWALVRGCYEADTRGRIVVGRGIVIDVTASKQDGYAEGRAHFLSADPSAEAPSPLNQLADHALQARRAVDRITDGSGRLRTLVDALLLETGRRIAAQFASPDDVDEQEPRSDLGRRH